MNTPRFSWPEGKSGAITSSWDDGRDHDRRLVEIFNCHGLKATWNLNSCWHVDGNELFVSQEEIATLYQGHEVAGHSYTHPSLNELSPDAMLQELVENRRYLESLVGYPVKGFALPNGRWDSRVVEMLRCCGFAYSRTTRRAEVLEPPKDFLEWHPSCHYEGVLDLWDRFLQMPNSNKLLYFWGHSYELGDRDQWDGMENIACQIGRREDMWYATNMEIYRYVTAWQSLNCSVDGSIVENTSAMTLWIRREDHVVPIGPGQVQRLDS